MSTYRIIESDVLRWAEERKIIPNSTSKAQAIKTLEEAGELLEAATMLHALGKSHEQYYYWLDKYRDAVGDVLVTLVNGAALADVDVVNCFQESYKEIKDRKGTMNKNGIFVKES